MEMTRDFNYNIAPQTINTARTIQALKKTQEASVPLPLAHNKNLTAMKGLYEGNHGEFSKITEGMNDGQIAEMAERAREAKEAKEAEEERKNKALMSAHTELEADREEFKDLAENLDKKWNNDLGGSWDVSDGSKVKDKIAQMEAKKDEAIQHHDEKIENLKEEKGSLEDEMSSTKDDEEKKKIEEKIKVVGERIETEEAKKEETKREEEEKIREKKEKLQQLKDRVYSLREEATRYKDDLERAKSYEDSPYWKDDIQRKQSEINLEIVRIDREITELTQL